MKRRDVLKLGLVAAALLPATAAAAPLPSSILGREVLKPKNIRTDILQSWFWFDGKLFELWEPINPRFLCPGDYFRVYKRDGTVLRDWPNKGDYVRVAIRWESPGCGCLDSSAHVGPYCDNDGTGGVMLMTPAKEFYGDGPVGYQRPAWQRGLAIMKSRSLAEYECYLDQCGARQEIRSLQETYCHVG
jgi:hypothetical protein